MDRTLLQLREECASVLAGLDAAQTQQRPAGRPEAWTIQQIVEHLLLTYAMTEKAINARLQKGEPTRAKPTLADRAGQFAVTTLGWFPSGRGAPEMVQPGAPEPALDGPQLSQKVSSALERMEARLAEAERAFGRSRCVNHAVLGPMRIAQWRRFHLAHAKHHCKQIAAIRDKA